VKNRVIKSSIKIDNTKNIRIQELQLVEGKKGGDESMENVEGFFSRVHINACIT